MTETNADELSVTETESEFSMILSMGFHALVSFLVVVFQFLEKWYRCSEMSNSRLKFCEPLQCHYRSNNYQDPFPVYEQSLVEEYIGLLNLSTFPLSFLMSNARCIL
jgi:hypothetical protein